jgi:two-component system, sensor histidine kinase PdtaS
MRQSNPEEAAASARQMSDRRLQSQSELAVQFGQSALGMHEIERVMDEACKVVSRGLQARFAKVLCYLPERHMFLLQAGVGWGRDEIGTAMLGADDASPAGYAFTHQRPVISNHLEAEHRFRTPELLVRYGVKRAINVPIRGVPEPYGVLEADSHEEDDFTESDIVFLEAISNVISMTRERILAKTEAQRDELFSASVLNASVDCIKVMTTDGMMEFMNENGLRQLEIDDFSTVQGKPWADLWPEVERVKIVGAVERAAHGEPTRFEAYCPTAKGQARWWDVSVAPIRNRSGAVERIVTVARDITLRHYNEETLSELISMQGTKLQMTELTMTEVHHRVRNSLQLIQTLLALQANLSGNLAVKNQLQAAATRVMTVGSVHQRLYQDNGTEATDAGFYLKGLIEDLSSSFSDRTIEFEASTLILPARRLAPLGLITAELITNAFKYGKGRVRVSLTPGTPALQLAVEDEGPGFPLTFPTPQGTGLGMRLIRTYAGYGEGSVAVDRTVPFSRIVVKFKVG